MNTEPSVEWDDATLYRDGWIVEYAHVGGAFRAIDLDAGWLDRLSTIWIARTRVPLRPAAPELTTVCAVARKILQRGVAPPIHPDAEKLILDDLRVERSGPAPGAMIGRAKKQPQARPSDRPWSSEPSLADSELQLDSDAERELLCDIVPELCGPGATRWFTPQASLDRLLPQKHRAEGNRRVDFLVNPPWRDPFIVEVDGQQHDAQVEVDRARDAALQRAGYETIRIPTSELRDRRGRGLQQLRKALVAPDSEGIPWYKYKMVSRVYFCTNS